MSTMRSGRVQHNTNSLNHPVTLACPTPFYRGEDRQPGGCESQGCRSLTSRCHFLTIGVCSVTGRGARSQGRFRDKADWLGGCVVPEGSSDVLRLTPSTVTEVCLVTLAKNAVCGKSVTWALTGQASGAALTVTQSRPNPGVEKLNLKCM